MKRFFLICLSFSVMLSGACKKKELNSTEAGRTDTAVSDTSPTAVKARSGAPKDALLIIVNEPDEEALKSLNCPVVKGDTEWGDVCRMLLIPAADYVEIKVEKVSYGESGFVAEELLYKGKECVLLNTVRPEGIPSYRITAVSGEGSAEYLVAYDGMNGTPPVEYVSPR